MIQVTITAIDGSAISPSRIRPIAQSQLVSPFMAPSTEGDTNSVAILFVPKTVNGQTTVEKWTISATFAATLTALSADNAIEGAALAADKDASNGFAGLTLFKLNMKNVAGTIISWFTNTNTAARTYTLQDRNGTIADDTDLALKANLASPTFTGVPAAPTAAPGTNTTQVATTEFVTAAAAALINAAPGALDTLDELAAAMGDDANFATTMTNALAGKEATANKNAAAGYAGLTANKLQLLTNSAGVFTTLDATGNTVSRAIIVPDAAGTLALTNQFGKAISDSIAVGGERVVADALITANSAVSVQRVVTGGVVAAGGYKVTLNPGVGFTIFALQADGITTEAGNTDTVMATIVY